jgi:hypothetical protein
LTAGAILGKHMSKLSEFVTAAATQAVAVIGAEAVTIDGFAALQIVPNSIRRERDFAEMGMDYDGRVECTVLTTEFNSAITTGAKSIQGKTATLGAETFRVRGVDEGRFFVTISLATPTKSS